MILLDGKKQAANIKSETAAEIAKAAAKGARAPGLAVILAGSDPASRIYVSNKEKACAEAGIKSFPFFLPEDVSQARLLELIEEINQRPDIDGILLQLPLPAGLDAKACLERIDPAKDVDGFHPLNVGRLCAEMDCFKPCTPAGMIELLRRYGLSVEGKKAVVLGRSQIVGKPLAQMLASRECQATVTICHTATRNLKEECLAADFLFTAIGKPRAVTADMIKPGCVIVDAGINRTPDGLRGDVDFEGARLKASAITPVPGGVGPMTIAMLLKNTLKAWRQGAPDGSQR